MAESLKRLSSDNDGGPGVKQLRLLNVTEEKKDSDSSTVPGRIASVELVNFMCHSKLAINFNTNESNCIYIGGPNGSGKSALFAALNIGLGGRGNFSERGSNVKSYIKEGTSRAKTRVVLINKGIGCLPNYGDFIAIERTISATCSTYQIKTSHVDDSDERVVSTRKRDVDVVLTSFGIQLDNPVLWMSQDRSRQFLQQMEPDKLYQIFNKATKLEATVETYCHIAVALEDMDRLCEFQGNVLAEQAREIKLLHQKRRRMSALVKMQNEAKYLAEILVWCPVRDSKEKINNISKHLEKLKETYEKCKKDIEDSEEKVSDVQQKKSQIEQRLPEANQDVDIAFEAVRSHDNAWRGKHEEYKDALHCLHNEERMAKELSCQVVEIGRQIEGIQEKKRRSEGMSISKMKGCIEKLCDQLKVLVMKKESNDAECSKLNDRRRIIREEERNLARQYREVEESVDRLERKRKETQAAAESEIASYGVNVPKILQIIRENASRFRRLPLGPLGLHVQLKDKTWALAVEKAISRYFPMFLFDNIDDQRIFRDLLGEKGIRTPDSIVSRFYDERYKTGECEPPDCYKTVKRVILVEDPNVFNAFVDQSQMESILLIENDEDARDLMSNNPPINAAKCFTQSGSEVFPRTSSKPYRFYANKQKRLRFLGGLKTVDESNLQEDLNAGRKRLKTLKEQAEKVGREHVILDSKITEMQVQSNRIAEDIVQKSAEKRNLEKKMEFANIDNSDEMISNLMKTRDEYDSKHSAQLRKVAAERDRVSALKKDLLKAEKEKLEMEMIMKKKKMQRDCFQDEVRSKSDEINQLENELELRKQRLLHASSRKHEVELALKEANAELETVTKIAEKSVVSAKSHSVAPPDLLSLPDTEVTQEQYNQLSESINALHACMGDAVSDEEINALDAKYHQARNEYNTAKRRRKALKRSFDVREKNFIVFREGISMKLMRTFSKLMSYRSFDGKLTIDHRACTIDIQVSKCGSSDATSLSHKTERHVLKDLKGLSGGERSFATSCFVMSLWEIMDSPFRLLDEFDVFMDLFNRKMVMEMLIDLATKEYKSNQFLFFTPQGVKEVVSREGVQIFEMPKVRD